MQQIEKLAKAFLADMEHSCDLGDTPPTKDKESISKQTLGQVLKALAGNYLIAAPEHAEENTEQEETETEPSPAACSFHASFKLIMPEEAYTQVTYQLRTLVDMRNDLVHHFIELFDLRSDSGCKAASEHLDRCYETIDARFLVMRGWAQSHQHVKEQATAFLDSKEFRDSLFQGAPLISPFDWEATAVVTALRQAEKDLAVDGWTELGQAIQRLSASCPDETPARYGCAGWRHLLHLSGLFEIRRSSPDSTGKRAVHFRSKNPKMTSAGP